MGSSGFTAGVVVEFVFRHIFFIVYIITAAVQTYFYSLAEFNNDWYWATLGLLLAHLFCDRFPSFVWLLVEWNRMRITKGLPPLLLRVGVTILWPFVVPLDFVILVVQNRIEGLRSGRRRPADDTLREIDIRREAMPKSLRDKFTKKNKRRKRRRSDSMREIVEAEETEHHSPSRGAFDACSCECLCPCSACHPPDGARGNCNDCVLKASMRFCVEKACKWCAEVAEDGEKKAWEKETGYCSCPVCRCNNIKCAFKWRCTCESCVERKRLLATGYESLQSSERKVQQMNNVTKCKPCGCTCQACLNNNCKKCTIRSTERTFILRGSRKRITKLIPCNCEKCRRVNLDPTACKCNRCACRRCESPKKVKFNIFNKDCTCKVCTERNDYLLRKAAVVTSLNRKTEEILTSGSKCQRRRPKFSGKGGECFDCMRTEVKHERRKHENRVVKFKSTSEILLRELYQISKCDCRKCSKAAPCGYHRVLVNQCESCKARAQLNADINEMENDLKIMGIPKAIVCLAEFCVQAYAAAAAGFVTLNHFIFLCSLALYCSTTIFAIFQLRRAILMTWWQKAAFWLNIFCKVVIGVVPISLILADASITSSVKLISVALFPAFLFQILLFLISGRRVRLGLRTLVAFINLILAAACLFLQYQARYKKFGNPSDFQGVENPADFPLDVYQNRSLGLIYGIQEPTNFYVKSGTGFCANNVTLLLTGTRIDVLPGAVRNATSVFNATFETVASSVGPPTLVNATSFTNATGVNGTTAATLTTANTTVNATTPPLIYDPDTLLVAPVDSAVYFSCFLSLHDGYMILVRCFYAALFFSLDFVPLILFVYPCGRFGSLERALGLDLDRVTCYFLPLMSFFMLMYVIAVEFHVT